MKRSLLILSTLFFSFSGCSSDTPDSRTPTDAGTTPDDLCGPLHPEGRCATGYRCYAGSCFLEGEFCSPQNPTGLCKPSEECSGGQCVDKSTICSSASPNGTCETGKTCLSGQCVDDALLCSVQSPTGLCPTNETCIDGSCVQNDQLCSPTNLTGICAGTLTCTNGSCSTPNPCSLQEPQGYCDSGQTCLDGTCTDNALLCSATNTAGRCVSGETCIDGTCTADSLLCSPTQPSGICPSGEVCFEGVCTAESNLCSATNTSGLCPADQTCVDGNCLNNSLLCSTSNPTGACAGSLTCVEGSCVDPATVCSATNPTGICPSGETCVDGNCLGNALLCSSSNPTGACSNGQTCFEGSCVDPSALCSQTNLTGLCPSGQTCTQAGTCEAVGRCTNCGTNQTCLDGICRDNNLLCSSQNPNGLCESGFDCIAGTCIDSGAGCSQTNPTGICPSGEICNNGTCEAIDQPVLCDDANECTRDWFDFARNRCAHEPQTVSCSDGNACTSDSCVAGICEGVAITGCIEPPTIDPYTTPTNDPTLILSGTKPSGASIEINTLEAVPQNPDTTWTVTLNLSLGENIYVIRSVDQKVQSATIEVRVVYDIQPPTTSLTPSGGVFLNGITVRVASDEAANVYYTTDGAEPDEWSKSFQSVKEFRVFDDTILRFRSLDLAGNWEPAPGVTGQFEITSHGNGWSTGPTLFESRIHSGAAVLDDVLYVAGGSDGLAPQAGVFSYDLTVTSTVWPVMPSLPNGRAQLALAASGGAIYAVGGENNGTPVGTITKLTPGDVSWEVKTPMPSTRFGLAVVPYANKLYVFGGKTNGGAVLNNLEVYTQSSDSWTNTAQQMPRARYGFGAIEYDGKVYVVGGEDANGAPIAEVDIYDIGGDSWSSGAPMPTPRSFASATLMTNVGSLGGGYAGIVVAGGRLLGGGETAKVEEYIVDDDAWRERTPLPAPRHSGSSVRVIKAGEVDTAEAQHWFLGGQTSSTLNISTMVYTAPQDYVRLLNAMPAARFMHAAAALNEKIYLFGGREFSETVEAWEFDPETETYTALTDLASFQSGLAAITVGDYVYAIGGADSFGNAVATVRAYDPVQGAWVEKQPMQTARRDPAVTAIGAEIFVVGGYNTGALQTFEIYDTEADTWQTGPVLPSGRTGAKVIAHHGDLYLIGGRDNSDQPISQMLRLTTSGSWQSYGASISAAYGSAFLIHDEQINVFAGRDGTNLTGKVWSFDIGGSVLFSPQNVELVRALDYSAATYLNGSIYLLGGNEFATPDPPPASVVQKIEGRCFNGVLDGREIAGTNGADSGGGCPLIGIEHHTGLGRTFYNGRPSDIHSQQGAIDACNAHYNTTSCSKSCSTNSCRSVTRDGNCNCSSNSYIWNYGSSCYSGAGAGTVEEGRCTDVVVGSWD